MFTFVPTICRLRTDTWLIAWTVVREKPRFASLKRRWTTSAGTRSQSTDRRTMLSWPSMSSTQRKAQHQVKTKTSTLTPSASAPVRLLRGGSVVLRMLVSRDAWEDWAWIIHRYLSWAILSSRITSASASVNGRWPVAPTLARTTGPVWITGIVPPATAFITGLESDARKRIAWMRIAKGSLQSPLGSLCASSSSS